MGDAGTQRYSARAKIFWILFCLGLLFAILRLAPVYTKYCEYDDKTNNEGCSLENVVVAACDYIGDKLARNGDVITALSTVAIAFFTLSLRQSTDKLWTSADAERLANEAARKEDRVRLDESLAATKTAAAAAQISASIAVDTFEKLERPFLMPVFAENFNAWHSNNDHIVDGLDSDMPRAWYSFKNYGRTPAIISSFGCTIEISGEVPAPVIKYSAVQSLTEIVILHLDSTERRMAGHILNEDIPAIRSKLALD